MLTKVGKPMMRRISKNATAEIHQFPVNFTSNSKLGSANKSELNTPYTCNGRTGQATSLPKLSAV